MLIVTSSYADALCQSDETYVTGCGLRNGKTVSFCANREGLTTYRYGKPGSVELAVTELKPGTMKISSESYARGAASEYQVDNGKYSYNFIDALYGNNDASYLMLELEHRGIDVPWLNENSLSHHTVNQSLTVTHEAKGELASLLCGEDSHFYGAPHKQAQYIHIMREVSDKYRAHRPEVTPQCQTESSRCVAIYEDFKQEFALVHFLSIDSSAFVNNKAYLIKATTGDISEIPLEQLTVTSDALATQPAFSTGFNLTIDGQQTVVSLEPINSW